VFIKLGEKVRRGTFLLFGTGGVLGQFYIEYGKLVETLFNVYENNSIMFQSLIVGSSIAIDKGALT